MSAATRFPRRWQAGLTLVEVVVALAVVAILALVALPRYQEYTVRSKVSEGLVVAAPARLGVASAFMRDGILPEDNEAAQLPAGSEIAGRHVSSVAVSNGSIVVTFGSNEPSISGRSLVLETIVSGGSVQWNCYSPDIPGRYLPAECRTVSTASPELPAPPESPDLAPVPPLSPDEGLVDGGGPPLGGDDNKGPPSHAGTPEHAGPPDHAGPPEHAGPPDHAAPRNEDNRGRHG